MYPTTLSCYYLSTGILYLAPINTHIVYTADLSPTDRAWPGVELASPRRGTQHVQEVGTATASEPPRNGANLTVRATAISSQSRPSSTSAFARA